MADELVEWVFEIDQNLYDAASKVCNNLGTTIEAVTEAFIRFCVVPENRPIIEAFFLERRLPGDKY